MDATQTSDPTEAGPGTPGRASAFRRALDEQALDAEVQTEGPLDLTVPLDFAEIRAALSGSGASRYRPPPPEAAAVPAADGGQRDGGRRRGRRGRGAGHAAPAGHVGSKRLGRIGVFVALATALSMGTAAALVFSSGGQGASVSLPTTNGNIPVATAPAAGSWTAPAVSPSPSAPRTTASTAPADAATASPAGYVAPPAASPSAHSRASASAGSAATASPSASASATAAASASASQSPGTPGVSGSPTGAPFTTLQQGSSGSTVSDVQQMLAQIDLLMQQRDRHHVVFVDVYNYYLSDPSGVYGQATATAVAAFQQANDVGTDPGVCDQSTYDALTATVSGQVAEG